MLSSYTKNPFDPTGFLPTRGNEPSATVGGPPGEDGEASALLALALTTAEPKVALGGGMMWAAKTGGLGRMHYKERVYVWNPGVKITRSFSGWWFQTIKSLNRPFPIANL